MEKLIRILPLLMIFLAAFISGQAQQVNGTVTDANSGKTMPGVNIKVKGTTVGASTNTDGNYSLTVPSLSDTLIFSFIGYSSKQIPIHGRNSINIQLVSKTITGKELVVVGYGKQQKSQVTGSISSISSEDITETPVTSTSEALQGKAAGVIALPAGNRPGQGFTVRIRGNRSLTASNNPLYVVDGIPLSGDLDNINPRDIESMEVLKGPSATAIYGARGANGVVLINTKRGGDYKTRVSYSGSAGVLKARNLPDFMNADQFVKEKEVSGRPFVPGEKDAIEGGVDTDWLDLILSNGFRTNHQLSVQGGNEQTKFMVSGSYDKERGVIKIQDFSRKTLRLNLDHNISDKLKIGTSTQLSDQIQNRGSGLYGDLYKLVPLGKPYDDEGNLNTILLNDPRMWNVMLDFENNRVINEKKQLRVFSNIFIDFDILKNLHYRMNFGNDFNITRRGVFFGENTSVREGSPNVAEQHHTRTYTSTFENILTFSEIFGDIHSLNVTGLYSYQTSNSEFNDTNVQDLPYDYQLFYNLGTAPTIEGVGSSLSKWGIMSFMGRVNYQIMSKYLVTITGRYDGSSRLSDENKWSFFPSVALGWQIGNEAFMNNQALISKLKLRGSYGATGNTAIDPYQTKGRLSRTSYNFGTEAGYGYKPSTISNLDLKWEVSKTLNLGLDFGLYNNRITGSFEVYRTNTSDLLLARKLPITSGYNSIFQNVGKTQTKGFEVHLDSRNISTSDFNWTTTVNFSGHKGKIEELYGTGENDVGNEWFIGEPLNINYDYKKIGIWQSDETDQAARYGLEPGQIKVKDINGDGILNEKDKVIQGSPIPTYSFGMGNRLSYRKFDLYFFIFSSFGYTAFDNFLVDNTRLTGRYNNLGVDYWTPDNPVNSNPKPDNGHEFPIYSSSRGYVPGDFLKIRNIKLGYNLPESLLSKIGIQNMKIYVNVTNPFVFTRLKSNVDPEIYGGTVGLDNQPNTRLYNAGINIDF